MSKFVLLLLALCLDTHYVSNQEELKTALDAAKIEKTTIEISDDFVVNELIKKEVGHTLSIRGNNHTITYNDPDNNANSIWLFGTRLVDKRKTHNVKITGARNTQTLIISENIPEFTKGLLRITDVDDPPLKSSPTNWTGHKTECHRVSVVNRNELTNETSIRLLDNKFFDWDQVAEIVLSKDNARIDVSDLNFKFENRSNSTAFRFSSTRSTVFRNVKCSSTTVDKGNLVFFSGCLYPSVYNVNAKNMRYVVQVAGGTRDFHVRRVKTRNCRHVVVPSTFCINGMIEDLRGVDNASSIDGHQAINITYKNVRGIGEKHIFNTRWMGGALINCRIQTVARETTVGTLHQNLIWDDPSYSDGSKFLVKNCKFDFKPWTVAHGLGGTGTRNYVFEDSVIPQLYFHDGHPIESIVVRRCKIGRFEYRKNKPETPACDILFEDIEQDGSLSFIPAHVLKLHGPEYSPLIYPNDSVVAWED